MALRRAFRIWRSDNITSVRLQFAATLASEIAERRWHASQRIEPTVDGGLILSMDLAEPAELERWLLGFGADVLVLGPKWLADRVRQIHTAAALNPRTTARSLRARSSARGRARRQGER